MERLWAPWRLAYVTSASGGTTDCIFCLPQQFVGFAEPKNSSSEDATPGETHQGVDVLRINRQCLLTQLPNSLVLLG